VLCDIPFEGQVEDMSQSSTHTSLFQKTLHIDNLHHHCLKKLYLERCFRFPVMVGCKLRLQ
jgi:hypothetical protein